MIHKIWPGARFIGILALVMVLALFGAQPGLARPTAELPPAASLTLDNVSLALNTSFLAGAAFTTATPGSASQVATAVRWQPFRELTVTAVPFGTRPGTEAVPIAQPGGAAAYLAALRQVRLAQGGTITKGPAARLFGQMVTGQATVVNLNVDGPELRPTLVVEWVVEAGPRLWIVRASQAQPAASAEAFAPVVPAALSQLDISSQTLTNATTVGRLALLPPALGLPAAPSSGDLPTPTWWSGDCDQHNPSYIQVNGMGSHRLGAVYLGLPACGPRPYADHVQDVVVRFFPGAWGELEWECVELSMRYLYLAYGIHPYSANGNMVVWHYSSAADGGSLQKIANGTANAAPQPGDVLSYDGASSVGHTSVVISATVDISGTGSLIVIEQNSSPTGAATLNVGNWYVTGNPGAISGWLHKPTWVPTNELLLPLIQR
jgi:hypothetical protein